MNEKKKMFRDRHIYNVTYLKKSRIISGKLFPAGSFVLVDQYTSSFSSGYEIYVATKIPASYKGKNPLLTLHVYSDCTGSWETDIFRNKISLKIWDAYLKHNKPEIDQNFVTDQDAANMMRHDRKHKSGSGRRDFVNTITDSMRFKQVTELAYWENLNNSKSGNASVVAAHIR